MNIRFWGVRGSLPAPLSPQQIRAKINSVVQRITPEDIVSTESRERFIASLPDWVYGTVGGNTPCVELTTNQQAKIIFDAGSGIRALGKYGCPPEDSHYYLFFSHFHWDHIQGLPFFDSAYNPNFSFDIYSPVPNFRDFLSNQMIPPYYPVRFEAFTKNIQCHQITESEPLKIKDAVIHTVYMSHPGGSYAYSVEEDGHKFVYATDVELKPSDFSRTPERIAVFQGADAIVMDSQYTVEEAYLKQNWGHSAFCYAIDFAVAWKIKKLYLFHHEPTYDDRKLHSILQSARWYANYISHNDLKVYLSVEGEEFQL